MDISLIKIVYSLTGRDRRERIFHLLAVRVITGIVEAAGPLIGGALTLPSFIMRHGWPLWITCMPYVVFFAILTFAPVVDQTTRLPCRESLRSTNVVRILSALVMTVTILVGLSRGGIYEPWGSAKISSLLVIGFSAAFVLGMHEIRWGRRALLSRQVIRQCSQKASLLVCFAHGFVRAIIQGLKLYYYYHQHHLFHYIYPEAND